MILKIKQTIIFAGDILVLYLSLVVTLLLRYGKINDFLIDAHLMPFSVIFVIWLAIFYIIGLYDFFNLKNNYFLFEKIVLSVILGTLISISVFYLIPYFHISPKTNLVIFAFVFLVLEIIWRILFNFYSKTPPKKTILIGSSQAVKEILTATKDNPQLGYEIIHQFEKEPTVEEIKKIFEQNKANTIILEKGSSLNGPLFAELCSYIQKGSEVIDANYIYESIFKKTPLSDIERIEVISSAGRSHKIYNAIKKPLEFLSSLIIFIVLLPLITLLYALVRITSRGPGIYKQIRVGKNEKEFSIYKFRTMHQNAEKDGPQWSAENDDRITWLGKILRTSHLDELPQLINVIKGDVSFVGPRPERPEFVKDLKKQIPYFEIRHLIKPGVTGWAQVRFRYGSSVDDSKEKLRYDLYYIKNRSFFLDFVIVLKTIKTLFG